MRAHCVLDTADRRRLIARIMCHIKQACTMLEKILCYWAICSPTCKSLIEKSNEFKLGRREKFETSLSFHYEKTCVMVSFRKKRFFFRDLIICIYTYIGCEMILTNKTCSFSWWLCYKHDDRHLFLSSVVGKLQVALQAAINLSPHSSRAIIDM